MERLQSRSYVFSRHKQRRRVRLLVLALLAFTGINVFFMIKADAQEREAMDRIVAEPRLLNKKGGVTSEFTVIGDDARFVFLPRGRSATIKFVCTGNGPPKCGESFDLAGKPAARGDLVFRTAGGVPVVRLTATGGATLLGGASFVPPSIPQSGRAVVRVRG